MKWILAILISTSLSGCIMFGSNLIHSPASAEGTPTKYHHVHGGATRNAPPDALTFFDKQDSTSIKVSARTISEKKSFGGAVLPIFPLFWFPKIDYYKRHPNSLFIEVLASSSGNIRLETDSTAIVVDDQRYSISNASQRGDFWELEFSVRAEQVDAFELNNLRYSVNDEPKALPTIKFQKLKQRWRFMGP